MALKAPEGNGGGKFLPQENIKPGTYPARLVQVIDFGLQPQRPYMGQDKSPAYEIGTTYELVDEFMKDENGNDIEDKPRWISESYPLYSLKADKAKSTARYLALDPEQTQEGNWAALLGQPVNVTIVNNKVGEKTYDNIATSSTMRARDADKCPALVNKSVAFDLDAPDLEVFNKFPKWIQDKIKGNLNYKGSKLEKLLGNTPAKDEPKEEKGPNPFEDGDDNDTPY